MRLFIFLPQLPYPPRSGGRIVTAPLIDGLAEKHEVFLFSLAHGFEGEEEGKKILAEKVTGVFTAPAASRIAPVTMAHAVCSRHPYKVHRFWNKTLSGKAKDLARNFPPDAVHCQNFYTALYARTIEAPRKILYKENHETRLLRRWEETTRNPLLKKLIGLERSRTERFELACTLWFDEIATLSDRDRKSFQAAAESYPEIERHLQAHLRTVRPSIDLAYYDPEAVSDMDNPFGETDRKNLLVTGSFNYYANVDGILWLADEVLPLLDSEKFSLWVVGQRPDPKVSALHAPPRVVVTGAVPDTRPFFKFAHLSLVPLRIGGGIRLKILESLAMGCPLISTSVGCEGLWNEDDPPVWKTADTPEAFAQAILRDAGVEPDRRFLRQWVRDRFSPARFLEEMENIYFE